jgi:glycerol-3-phosphate acyltransferase PlsY
VLAPGAAAVCAGIFTGVMWRWRIVSLASIVAVLTVPVTLLALGVPRSTTIAMAAIALLVVARHHENVRRLIAGTEPRMALPKDRAMPKA